jgi:AraC family ethanolamine operon transcriptional activator
VYVQHQHFDDADRHAASLQGWEQSYDQIGPGAFRSAVKQLTLDGMQVFYEAANLRVVQRGNLPPDHAIIGIPMAGSAAFSFGGVRLDDGGVVVASGGAPFELHTPDDMSLVAVMIDPDVLQSVADAAGVTVTSELFRRNVVDMPKAACRRAGYRLAAVLERVLAQPDAFRDAHAQRSLRSEVGEVLVDLLTYHVPDQTNRLTYACQSDIVRRIHNFVLQYPEEPIEIQHLCSVLRVSRRTVQNSFQSVVQTSPVNYLRSLRLAQVRRLLLATRQSDLAISEAAARWGFLHLGHFASAYKNQFGELPSHTARRAPRVRSGGSTR